MMILASLLLPVVIAPAMPAATARLQVAAQVAAWNRGDMESALASYCPSPKITWVNRAGLSRGYDAFAQSMRDDFAGPGKMGVLTNHILEARDLGDGQSLVVLRWSITRDGKRLMGGVSSQLWAQCDGRLRIVFEHAS